MRYTLPGLRHVVDVGVNLFRWLFPGDFLVRNFPDALEHIQTGWLLQFVRFTAAVKKSHDFWGPLEIRFVRCSAQPNPSCPLCKAGHLVGLSSQ